MRRASLAVATLLLGSLAVVPFVAAEDPPKPAEARKDAVVLRVDRARQIVTELEAALVKAKAAQPVDPILLQKLMEALDLARALAKPARPDELTAEEKKAVLDEAKKSGGDAPSQGNDWQERQLVKAFEGADLTEEETIKARTIIGEWFKESMASMGDSKKSSDLKRKRDDDLEKAIGKKKAQKVINNLNSMGPGRR